ncbi:nitrogen fixation protein NifM [Nitrincola alkalisediminis]|uniref:nitrogen fixation protein NifM n=1 Tax=Nitrincola alkalisediminis TaxID=1366656 RepID=UPI00187351E5|nr:nitrogen fixation protein NifM [Nitrincola alkalisediminis]
MQPEASETLAYLELKIAESQLSSTPDQLAAETRAQVSLLARRQFRLEQKILASDEAQQVFLPDATLEEAYQRIQSRYETDALFAEALSNAALTPSGFKAALSQEMRVEAILERVSSHVEPITQDEAELYYYTHLERFQLPERRQASHLLITVDDDQPDSDLRVYRKLCALLEKIKQKPTRFDKLVLRYSECPTAMNGGHLGLVAPGLLYEALDNALFKMQLGKISEPIRSPMGYHLLRFEALYPATRQPFAEVCSAILELLTERQKLKYQKDWVRHLGH